MRLFFGAIFLLGCGKSTEATIAPEAPLQVMPEALYDRPVSFVGGLPDESALVASGRELLIPSANGPIHLGSDAGAAHDLLVIGRGSAPGAVGAGGILVGGDKGLFAIVARLLEQSPIAADVGMGSVLRILDSGAEGAPRVFIVTTQGLHLWRNGMVEAVTLSGTAAIDWTRVKLAARHATPSTSGALFLLTPDTTSLLRIDSDRATPGVTTIQSGQPARDLAVDGAGVLWIALADGSLLSIDQNEMATHHVLPVTVKRVLADAAAPDLWMVTDSGLWHERLGAFQPVHASLGAYVGSDMANGAGIPDVLSADIGGALLVAGPGGAARIRPGADVMLGGLPTSVDAPVMINVVAPHPGDLSSLKADLDGVAQWTDLASHAVVIDPWSVEGGVHKLTVTVGYTAGASLSTSAILDFTTPPGPTWSGQVQSLYMNRCSACHGPGGSGHRMDTLADWQASIDKILSAIDDKRMPLPPRPPLPGVESVTLHEWKSRGLLP